MTTLATLQPIDAPLHGVQLIEASAGTGKTWTIAAVYLRLVLGDARRAPLLPPQILVLTFTKAATAELRERIRARLAEAAEVFRARRAADDYLTELLAHYPEGDARALAARQLELAAQWMDEAAVFTIHGWCQRMLGQHAFDSGHPLLQEVNSDESALLAEAVRDYWRQHCFVLDREHTTRISAQWADPTALQAAVAPLLRQPPEQLRVRGQPLPQIDDIARMLSAHYTPLNEAEDAARQAWRTHAPALATLLREALQAKALNGKTYTAAKLDNDLAALDAWVAGAELPGREVIERASQAKLVASTNKNGTTPTHAGFATMEHLLAALDATDSPRPLLLAHAVPRIAARLQAAKQRLAQMGYDDMLTRLDQALHGVSGARLASTIATQYPVALIDEFQDTDPLQWRIFQRIYANPPQAERADTGLLLIGDPKQAIYGFRGADIHTYLRARRCAQSPTWTLDTNYRSTESLVRAINQVFEHAEQHPRGAFAFGKGDNALPFFGVRAHGRKETLLLEGEPVPALQLARAAQLEPIGKSAYQEQMADHAAACLVRLLDAAQRNRCGFDDGEHPLRPLQPGDVAILVRNRNEAACMRQALRARGLASVYLSDRESVYASPEAGDLLLWLRACAEPGSDRAMRAALATATLGQDYAALDRLNRDEASWEAMSERFRQLHELWLKHGVLAMLHELLHRFELPAQLLRRHDGERALTNLLHLAELLQQAAATLDGEHALLRQLANQLAEAADAAAQPADEKIVRLESEAALIQVITIHKSKGLEYPLVLLPFICLARETRLSDRFVLHDGDGGATLDLVASEADCERADRERLQEDLRLFYVAMTRAVHACWLGVANLKDGQKKTSGLHKSAFGYVLNGDAPLADGELAARLKALADACADVHLVTLDAEATTRRYHPSRAVAPDEPARRYHGAPVEPWWIASYSALRVNHENAARPAAPETARQDLLAEGLARGTNDEAATRIATGIHAFPRGAEPGTFLHELLEWCADAGFAAAANMPPALQTLIARRCQRRNWEEFADTLSRWLPAFLRTPLPLHDGERVSLADAQAQRAELEFWFEACHVDTLALDRLVSAHTLGARARPALLADQLNGMLKGFVDLIVEHAGRWYVVDYKSNWLGNDERAYTVDAMDASVRHSRYDLQYAIYTLALHRQLRARLPGYDYERHIGGVLYLYLRGVDDSGHGVHAERLPFALIDAMDRLFAHGGSRDVA